MSSMAKKLTFALVTAFLALTAASCASSICERKHSVMTKKCSGGDLAYHPDVTCEEKVKRCTEGQLAQFNAYVSCLESVNVCSMETMSQCAAAHPGGVNLACG